MPDPRYAITKVLIKRGHTTSFKQIFDTIPKTIVAKDLGVNNIRFSRLIENPELINVKLLNRIAGLFDIEPGEMFEVVNRK